MTFSGEDQHRGTSGGQQHKVGPGASFEVPPHDHSVVVDDRVLDLVLKNSISDLLGSFLVLELRRVATHEND